MTHGEVTVWYMTEQQRLDYIEKHPIIPTESPKGTTFSNLHEYGQRAKKIDRRKGSVMDQFDKDAIQRRFVAGEKLKNIADSLGVTLATLDHFIGKQRKVAPDKWPYRR